jgi:hypothetical protein
MTLYAVLQDRISQASKASIVEVLAKDGKMLVDKLQPVLQDLVPGSDLKEIIRTEVSALKAGLDAAEKDIGKLKKATSGRRGSYAAAVRQAQAEGTAVLGGLGEPFERCPAGTFMVSLQLLKVGQETAQFWYDCRALFEDFDRK